MNGVIEEAKRWKAAAFTRWQKDKTMNKKDAFAQFGVVQLNERWSWSGVSEDQRTLVLTLWTDQYQFDKETKIHHWSTFNCDSERWVNDHGNSHRIRDIQFALEHLEGRFRGIAVTPDSSQLPERVILTGSVKPLLHLEWQITDFDPATGECSGTSFPERRPFTR